jgi:hypothetical protein
MQTAMNKFKKVIAGVTILGMLAIAGLMPAVASAQIFGGLGGNNLGNLFLLNDLFNGPFGNSGGFTSLGDLLLWNQLANGNGIFGNSLFGNGIFGI